MTSTSCMFVRSGNIGWRSTWGPSSTTLPASTGSPKTTAWGLPTETRVAWTEPAGVSMVTRSGSPSTSAGRSAARKEGLPNVELTAHARTGDLENPDRVGAIAGPDLELLRGAVLEDGVGRRDPQAVTALLSLAPVGVEDPYRKRRRVEGEQAVAAQPELAMAEGRQQPDQLLERSRQVEHQVVVAERLVLDQSDRHRREG